MTKRLLDKDFVYIPACATDVSQTFQREYARLNSRHSGKTAAMEREIAAFVKKNPEAVVARFRSGELLVEKPVSGEVIGMNFLKKAGQ